MRFISKIYISDQVNETEDHRSYFEIKEKENIEFSPLSIALVKLTESKEIAEKGGGKFN